MAGQRKTQGKNKLIKWILLPFLLYFLFFIADAMDAPIIRAFLKPYGVSGWEIFYDLSHMRNAIIDVIMRERDQRGAKVDYNNRQLISITNKEEFMNGLMDGIRQSSDLRGMKSWSWFDVAGLFDARAFKIIVLDNRCFIRVDLNKLSNHISRNPLRQRESLANSVAFRSNNAWGIRAASRLSPVPEARRLWEVEDAFNEYISRYGARRRYESGRSFRVFGNSDMSSPILFTEDMNEFYILIFVFSNEPPQYH